MERSVVEAAVALVRPSTAPSDRSRASAFLEDWTRSNDVNVWLVYVQLVHASMADGPALSGFAQGIGANESDSTLFGCKLLILTMLHRKVRSDGASSALRARPDVAMSIRDAVHSSLAVLSRSGAADAQQQQLLSHLSSTAAAIAVHFAGLLQATDAENGPGSADVGSDVVALVRRACTDREYSPKVALRILSFIPEEAQASDWKTADVHAVLDRCTRPVLNTVHASVAAAEGGGAGLADASLALRVLSVWASPSHVTLSQLQLVDAAESNNAAASLLTMLVQILSQSQPLGEELLATAATALTEAVREPFDICTPTHRTALAFLLRSIPQGGFLLAPLRHATVHRWDTASHAMATLAEAIASDEIEFIALCEEPGCFDLIQILLDIQNHPHHAVAIVPMDFWLTLQSLPTSQRHPDLAAPLFSKLLEVLLRRMAYHVQFTTWEDELNMDSQEFEEMRNLAKEVLGDTYRLLRVKFVEQLIAAITSSPTEDWVFAESALFSLCTVSREVCTKIKTRSGGTSMEADRAASSQHLVTLVTQLVAAGPEAIATRHPLVLAGVVTFIGAYAPVWNASDASTPDAILGYLSFLRTALAAPTVVVSEAAGKSCRQLMVACSDKLVGAVKATSPAEQEAAMKALDSAVSTTMEAALSRVTSDGGGNTGEGLRLVAEGATRFCVSFLDLELINRMLHVVLSPVVNRIRHAMNALSSSSPATSLAPAQMEEACLALTSYLGVVGEIVRFSEVVVTDSNAGGSDTTTPTEILTALLPILAEVAENSTCQRHEGVVTQILETQSQLLKVAPTVVAPHFSQHVSFAVRHYEDMFQPAALEYMASAVESFGKFADQEASFAQLLTHVSQVTCNYVRQQKRPSECPQVIRAFFEMTKRYLIFCPRALLASSEFNLIFSLAVACLSECRGEVLSTRAALNFLSHLIGWRPLRLGEAAIAVLEASASSLSATIRHHGQAITKASIEGLLGGAPQMLSPSFSDCLVALLTHMLSEGQTPGQSPAPPSAETVWVVQQWISLAVTESAASGTVDASKLTDEARRIVVDTLLNLATTNSRDRARSLLLDFGKISRGEIAPDALISYTLN